MIYFTAFLGLVAAVIAYRVSARRTMAVAEDVFHAALDQLLEAQETLNESHEQNALLHSTHVSLLLEVLEHHVEETGKGLDDECTAIVATIRPFYETQTIH